MGRTVRSGCGGRWAINRDDDPSPTPRLNFTFPIGGVDGGSRRGVGTGRRGIDAHLQLLRGELREVNALLLRHDTRCRPNPCGI